MAQEKDNFKVQIIASICGFLLTLSAVALNVSKSSEELAMKQLDFQEYTPRQCLDKNLTSNPFIAEVCNICDKDANIKKLSDQSFMAACMGPAKGIFVTATEGFELKRGKVLHLKLKSPYITHSETIDI